LLAQITDPLAEAAQSAVAVHAPPSWMLPAGAPFPLQTPPAHSRPLQQAALLLQAPPAVRQQLSAPSLAKPLSAQIAGPPVWLH
jgi:hypothetical protein